MMEPARSRSTSVAAHIGNSEVEGSVGEVTSTLKKFNFHHDVHFHK